MSCSEPDELVVVSLPDGEPEVGDYVKVEYRSKRSGNILSREGTVIKSEVVRVCRFEFKVREPDREGYLKGNIDVVGGTHWVTDPGDLTGQLGRKTRSSEPHYAARYGPIMRVEIVSPIVRCHNYDDNGVMCGDEATDIVRPVGGNAGARSWHGRQLFGARIPVCKSCGEYLVVDAQLDWEFESRNQSPEELAERASFPDAWGMYDEYPPYSLLAEELEC